MHYRKSPWGDEWLQTAVISAASANANPYRKRAAKVEDYMPQFKDSIAVTDLDAIERALAGLAGVEL